MASPFSQLIHSFLHTPHTLYRQILFTLFPSPSLHIHSYSLNCSHDTSHFSRSTSIPTSTLALLCSPWSAKQPQGHFKMLIIISYLYFPFLLLLIIFKIQIPFHDMQSSLHDLAPTFLCPHSPPYSLHCSQAGHIVVSSIHQLHFWAFALAF